MEAKFNHPFEGAVEAMWQVAIWLIAPWIICLKITGPQEKDEPWGVHWSGATQWKKLGIKASLSGQLPLSKQKGEEGIAGEGNGVDHE